MTHRYHPDPEQNDPPDALVWDDCEDCEVRAQDPRTLDGDRLTKAWEKMIKVELSEKAVYLTANERVLGRELYKVFVIAQKLGSDL